MTPTTRDRSTPLACGKCGTSIVACQCPDMDERLRQITDSPYVAFKWCLTCDKHYARCQCDEPLFGVRSGGKTMNMVPR